MTPQDKATARLMLTLSAITYRGISLALPEQLKRARLRQLMDDCMNTFSAVRGRWKIVWGPASFSAVSPGFDDALMYVAQNGSQLAIAIRGTNPISATDWIFGDLMVTRMVPWPYLNPPQGAAVSASTMIGLEILQHLTWSAPQNPPPAATRSTATTVATSSGAVDWSDLLQVRLASEASSLVETLKANVTAMAGQRFNPLGLLRKQPGPSAADETSLKEFLAATIAALPNPQIYVTGHSKGGALSPTVALWLKDTQGIAIGPDSWDPKKKATIFCYSFAGPTAGNDAFAQHSDAVLGANCVRIWNERDAVPRAFVPALMRDIPTVYQLSGLELAAVGTLVNTVAAKVTPFHYQQLCGDGVHFDGGLVAGLSFPLQMIHQHLDAYLKEFGLDNEMSALSLLAPVVPWPDAGD